MKKLKEIKSELKKLLTDKGTCAVIDGLKELIPQSNLKFNDLLLLEVGRKELTRKYLEGLLTEEQQAARYNKINKQLLSFIEGLEKADFKTGGKQSKHGVSIKSKQGHVLYKIPGEMQLGKIHKCFVRIAISKKTLLKSISKDLKVELKEMRISDYMLTQMVDPSSAATFEIKEINSPIQFVDVDDFTEWQFRIKPLKSGIYPLLLKIAVIEMIGGQEIRREIVLEQQVEITTKEVDRECSYQTSPYLLTLGLSSSGVTISTAASSSWFKKAVFTFTLIGFVGLIAMPQTRMEMTWMWMKLTGSFEKYLTENPKGKYREEAKILSIRRNNNREKNREYLAEFGTDGKYSEEVLNNLVKFTDEITPLQRLVDAYPEGSDNSQAEAKLESLEFREYYIALKAPSLLSAFLDSFPTSRFTDSIASLMLFPDSFNINEDSRTQLNLIANDLAIKDSFDLSTFKIITPPSSNQGRIEINGDGTIDFLPALNFFGRVDNFYYEICGQMGACYRTSVIITVAAVDDPIRAVNDFATISVTGQPVIIDLLANDEDPDGDLGATSLLLLNFPRSNQGTLTKLENGKVSFLPATGFVGVVETISYRVCDSTYACSTAKLSITVKSGCNYAEFLGPSGKSYKTFDLFGATWLAENLDIETTHGSWCNDKIAANCDENGLLYTFEAAQEVCRTLGPGWQLPSRSEWLAMLNHFGGTDVTSISDLGQASFRAVKNGPLKCLDINPNGLRFYEGGAFSSNVSAYFWSRTARSTTEAYYVRFQFDRQQTMSNHDDKRLAFSVRCVK